MAGSRSKSLAVLCLSVIYGFSPLGSAKAQGPSPGVAYRMPAGTQNYAAGTLVPFGGYDYVAQGDGTMRLAAGQPRASEPRTVVATQVVPRTRVYVPTTTYVGSVSPAWGISPMGFPAVSYSNWGYPAVGYRSFAAGGWGYPGVGYAGWGRPLVGPGFGWGPRPIGPWGMWGRPGFGRFGAW